MSEYGNQELIEMLRISCDQNRRARKLGLRDLVIATARTTRNIKSELRSRGVIVR